MSARTKPVDAKQRSPEQDSGRLSRRWCALISNLTSHLCWFAVCLVRVRGWTLTMTLSRLSTPSPLAWVSFRTSHRPCMQ